MRKTTTLVAATVLAMGLSASQAEAEMKTVTFAGDCATDQPHAVPHMSLAMTADIPTSHPMQSYIAEERFTSTLELDTAALRARGGTTLDAAVKVHITITGPGQRILHEEVAMDVRHVPVTSDKTTADLIGYKPTMDFTTQGQVSINVSDVALTVQPSDKDGKPMAQTGGTCAAAGLWMSYPVTNTVADPIPPPGMARVGAVTEDSITLSYGGGGGGIAPLATGHVVLVDERQVLETVLPVNQATVTGLRPDTDYWVRVRARTDYGLSTLGPVVKVRTKAAPKPVVYDYALTGKSQVKGSPVALAGNAQVRVAVGQLPVTVTLEPTTAVIKLFGVIPVAADVRLTATDAAGTFKDGALVVTSKLAIAVPKVSFLGYPLMQSATCQTNTDVTVASAPGFDPATGGVLTGTYPIPPFTGCGPFTSLITGAVSGSGNTVEITLAR